ncbi:MAG: enoyl-CoA hydratase/isomerase family protein [Rhodobacteraceae bacterium]|nr:enoyl-CoA hydratase/isomerase family protein [Paracoccaceae bacterium]
MSDIHIGIDGRAGRITLNRPKALNAVTYDMCLAIEAALDRWRDDDAVDLVIIDAVGDKAFCAGGDLSDMYRTASAGDYEYGRKFWRDEYRLNAKIAAYSKPYVALMQGYTMGGGVGISCHGSHRIVCESSVISMPEVGVGLVPDVGGSWLLARAPGHLGEYLGTTAARMKAADAIYAGFADSFVPRELWDEMCSALTADGDVGVITAFTQTPDASQLEAQQGEVDALFSARSLAETVKRLEGDGSDLAQKTVKALARMSPLSAAVAFDLVRKAREVASLEDALALEYRATSRAAEHGDFVEGIRAVIIDKDNAPKWRHDGIADVAMSEIWAMLAPLDRGSAPAPA